MKKANFTTGGWPVIAEYLLGVQDGMADAIKGAASNLPDCIFTGVAISNTGGTNYSCTAGYLKWNGEIYYVPAHTLVITGGQVAVAYLSATNTAVPVEYQSGDTPAMLINTEVKFKGAAVAGVGEKLFSAFSTEHYLPGDWQDAVAYEAIQLSDTFYLGDNWTTGAHFAAGGTQVGWKLRGRRVGNWLELDGNCKFAGAMDSGDLIVGYLPALFRPNNRKVIVVAADGGGDEPVAATIRILANGQMTVNSSISEDLSLSFAGVRIRLT